MNHFTHFCERCGEYFAGASYRVTSEDDGERLLDMVVCYSCYIEAWQLGLDTQKVESEQLALH